MTVFLRFPGTLVQARKYRTQAWLEPAVFNHFQPKPCLQNVFLAPKQATRKIMKHGPNFLFASGDCPRPKARR